MTVLQAIRKVRRVAYRTGSIGGDVEAIVRATQGHPEAIPKRIVRKAAYRETGRILRRILR